MAINFDTLPQENPFALPTPGLYKATIDDAEMRRNKNDATKPPYLNLKYKLTDMEGKSKGVMFLNLTVLLSATRLHASVVPAVFRCRDRLNCLTSLRL